MSSPTNIEYAANKQQRSKQYSFQNIARVEAKVTASRVNGRRCTEINHNNVTTIDSGATTNSPLIDSTIAHARISTDHLIASDATDPNSYNRHKRGFQHVYKSTKTPSSLRVHAAHNATVNNGTARTKNAMTRDSRKKGKWTA
jgi:hypothetical protein